jgi:hypothetical protein
MLCPAPEYSSLTSPPAGEVVHALVGACVLDSGA